METPDNLTKLVSADDAASVNWGGAWRMPTSVDFQELKDKCTWSWTTLNGKNGYLVTGTNGNSLFLPAAGYFNGDSPENAGSHGFYWSSSLCISSPNLAYHTCFLSNSVDPQAKHSRYIGCSVRPVR